MPQIHQGIAVAIDHELDIVHEVSVREADGAEEFVELVAERAVGRVLECVEGVVERGAFEVGEAAGEGEGEGAGAAEGRAVVGV